MAKVLFGAVITDSRGSVAGHTIKWSRFGHVLQSKRSPTLRMTSHTQEARAVFADLSKRWWAALTPTQRTAWRDLAAANPRTNVFGIEFPLTGLALYIGINRLLTTAGYSALDDAPGDQTYTALATATLTATAPATLSLAWTPTPVPADHVLYLFARSDFSPGITNSAHRTLFLTASAELEVSPLDLSGPWSARFGDIHADKSQLVTAAFLNVTNGAISPAIPAQTLAT